MNGLPATVGFREASVAVVDASSTVEKEYLWRVIGLSVTKNEAEGGSARWVNGPAARL